LKDHPLYHEADPLADVIAIDECHFDASDYVRYGWIQKGRRLPKRKKDRPQRLSLLLAVSKTGVVETQVVRGSVNSEIFLKFLAVLPPGRTLLLDNASIHRARIVKDFCRKNDTTLKYLPSYSPWYNPAEYAFSAIKSTFRRRRLTSDDFEGDVGYAVATLPNMIDSFCHATNLLAEDAAMLLRQP
jgi:transposase